MQKEEEELSKIATGIGKVFLQNVREREKLRQWKMSHLDPRNASRTPSAAKEPINRLRYESPINACEFDLPIKHLHCLQLEQDAYNFPCMLQYAN